MQGATPIPLTKEKLASVNELLPFSPTVWMTKTFRNGLPAKVFPENKRRTLCLVAVASNVYWRSLSIPWQRSPIRETDFAVHSSPTGRSTHGQEPLCFTHTGSTKSSSFPVMLQGGEQTASLRRTQKAAPKGASSLSDFFHINLFCIIRIACELTIALGEVAPKGGSGILKHRLLCS